MSSEEIDEPTASFLPTWDDDLGPTDGPDDVGPEDDREAVVASSPEPPQVPAPAQLLAWVDLEPVASPPPAEEIAPATAAYLQPIPALEFAPMPAIEFAPSADFEPVPDPPGEPVAQPVESPWKKVELESALPSLAALGWPLVFDDPPSTPDHPGLRGRQPEPEPEPEPEPVHAGGFAPARPMESAPPVWGLQSSGERTRMRRGRSVFGLLFMIVLAGAMLAMAVGLAILALGYLIQRVAG